MAGAATAYHLAKRTDLAVLIVEQEQTAGVHSSGRNAAIIREYADEPALQQLLSEGAQFLRRGELAEYEQRGLMVMGQGDDDVQKYFSRAHGSGLWCPQDGTVDVAALLQSYLARQKVRYKISVEDWTDEGDMIEAMREEAARLGAHGIIIEWIEEPRAWEHVIDHLTDIDIADRRGKVVAIRAVGR